jgi:hypothetical protein
LSLSADSAPSWREIEMSEQAALERLAAFSLFARFIDGADVDSVDVEMRA